MPKEERALCLLAQQRQCQGGECTSRPIPQAQKKEAQGRGEQNIWDGTGTPGQGLMHTAGEEEMHFHACRFSRIKTTSQFISD